MQPESIGVINETSRTRSVLLVVADNATMLKNKSRHNFSMEPLIPSLLQKIMLRNLQPVQIEEVLRTGLVGRLGCHADRGNLHRAY